MRWNKEDIRVLEKNFQKLSHEDLAKLIGCDKKRIIKKASRLGLKKDYLQSQPNLEGELWKDVIENDNYLVSNKGRFRNKNNNRLLKPWYSGSDYYYVDLEGKAYLAHRVVARAWVENPDKTNKTEVNHIKGIKSDFRPSELEWVTPKENMRHAHDTGIKVGLLASENPASKLNESDVIEIRLSSLSSRVLAEKYGVNKKTILNILNNKTYKSVKQSNKTFD